MPVHSGLYVVPINQARLELTHEIEIICRALAPTLQQWILPLTSYRRDIKLGRSYSDDRSNDSRVNITFPYRGRITSRLSTTNKVVFQPGLNAKYRHTYLKAGRTSLCDVIMTSDGGATRRVIISRRTAMRSRPVTMPSVRARPAGVARPCPVRLNVAISSRWIVAAERPFTARLRLRPFTSSTAEARPGLAACTALK